MLRSLAHAACLALALMIPATAAGAASPNPTGGCTLSFPVGFDGGGGIVQTGGGRARCAGSLGRTGVSPSEVAAFVGGEAAAGLTGCAPRLVRGTLSLEPQRLISFNPHPEVSFTSTWTASSGLLSGRGWVGSAGVVYMGDIRFVPAGVDCAVGRFAPGTLQMDLVVSDRSSRATRTRGRARRQHS